MISQMLFGSAAAVLAGFATPASVSGSALSSTITTASLTITPVNAVGTISYSWALVAGTLAGATGCVANSPASATTTFTFSGVPASTSGSAIFRCTLTDATTGQTATVDVSCDCLNLN